MAEPTGAEAAAGAVGGTAGGGRGVVVLALVAGVVLLVALAARGGFGPVDDAYISLRYARNLVHGHGLVFNPGEWVEGYTNFLWTLLLALGLELGAPGPALAVALGYVSGALLLAATVLLHRRVAGTEAGGWRVAATPVALALSPTLFAYVPSGLESGFFALLLVLHAWLLVGRREGAGTPRALVGAGLVLALANLTRPEATAVFVFDLVALALLAAIARTRGGAAPSARALAGFAAAFALPFGAFLLWRYATYGAWLPNTYYAKVGAPSARLVENGLGYAWAIGLRSLALPALLLVLATGRAFRDLRLLYLAGLVLVVLAAVALEGGDHLALWRFGLPVLPFAVLLAREGLEGLPLRRLSGPAAAVAVVLCFAGAALWTARSVRVMPGSTLRYDRDEYARAQLEVDLAQGWSRFGRWLAANSAPGDAVALLPIGAIGWWSDRPVIDEVGLVDAHIAHLDVPTGRGYVGHEKYDNAYVLARRPRFVLGLHLVTLSRPIGEASYDRSAFFAVHRDLLARPELHRDYVFRCVRGGDGVWFAFYERKDAARR